MTDVLGTPVRVAVRDDAPVLLISDLHVPVGGGAVLPALQTALDAARSVGARVVVLGDLFDTYVARRQVTVGVWRDVAAMFAAAAANGTGIEVLHGNRDFLLGPEFERASRASLVRGGLRLRTGGTETLLVHGDELCQNDLPYQRAKRWLRNPLLGAIVRRLPLVVALRLAERARRRSRAVVRFGDQTRFLPTGAAIDAAFGTGVQRLVFGHIHRFAHGRRGAGEYWVLPAFDEAATGLLLRGGGVEPVRFSRGGGFEGVPVPGPLPLTDGGGPTSTLPPAGPAR
ncbi:MAG: metallophosphoesterase [Planctomycetes bacterium]|nr:metallophosphoesterase [Planctomycetota bacterium]